MTSTAIGREGKWGPGRWAKKSRGGATGIPSRTPARDADGRVGFPGGSDLGSRAQAFRQLVRGSDHVCQLAARMSKMTIVRERGDKNG